MKRAIFSIVVVAVFILLCCANADNKQNNTENEISVVDKVQRPVKIELSEDGKQDLKISYFTDSVMYVPLETNENCYLRWIAQLKKNNSLIVISDMRKVLVFRNDGSFLRQIGRRGKGPGEYGTIGNIELYKDTVYVAHQQSISKYTLDGTFQGEHKLSMAPSYFNTYSDGLIALYYEYDGNIYYYNHNFEIIDTLTVENNVSPDRANWQMFSPWDLFFQTSKYKLLFTNYLSDTIWDISQKNKSIAYILNLGDKLLPWDKQVAYFKGDFERYKKVANPYRKVNIKEYPGYLFIYETDWSKGNLHTVYIHRFADNSTRAFNNKYIYDDILGNIKLPLWRYSLSADDEFIIGAHASDFLESVSELNQKEGINTEAHKSWKKKMSNVKEGDNPILLIMKPRK